MPEGNDRSRYQFRMSRPFSQVLQQAVKSLLTSAVYVPVLGAPLDKGHRNSKGVHPGAELRIPEKDFFGHVLMAPEHSPDLAASSGQAQVGPLALISAAMIKQVRGLREATQGQKESKY